MLTQKRNGKPVWFVHLPLSSRDSSLLGEELLATERGILARYYSHDLSTIAPSLSRLGKRRYQFPIRETCSFYVYI